MDAYDEVLYDDFPFAEAHPARLGAIGALFGVQPPPLERVRVLDLGCGLGGHVLPLASTIPGGTFVGIDASSAQIHAGNTMAVAAGLGNVELRSADLRDPGPLDTYDVIVAHGVYSWVPEDVREAIWDIVRRHLAPRGIAYISANMLPGWHQRGTVRSVLSRVVPADAPPEERIRHAREALDVWGGVIEGIREPRIAALHTEISTLAGMSDAYLLHEHLAEVNAPVWFDELVAQAGAHGLRYLADAMIQTMFPVLTPQARAWVEARARSTVQMEALHDLLVNRLFRRALFVRDGVPVDHHVVWGRLDRLWLACDLAEAEADDGSPVFRSALGAEVTMDDPIGLAAVRTLSRRSPAGMPFRAVVEAARDAIASEASAGADRAAIGKQLVPLITRGLVHITTGFPAITTTPGSRPTTTRLARAQAARLDGAVNLRHQRVRLSITERAVLRRLDGEHDRETLVAALRADIAAGVVEVRVGDRPVDTPMIVGAVVDGVLEKLAAAAFLLG